MFGEYFGLKAVLDQKANKPQDATDAIAVANKWNAEQGAVLCSKLNSKLWDYYGISDRLPA